MNTKKLILQLSLELFAKKRYDGVSVREIAKAVGVREQFNHPDIAALVEDHFFHKVNSKIIALHFYGPILLLFQWYLRRI